MCPCTASVAARLERRGQRRGCDSTERSAPRDAVAPTVDSAVVLAAACARARRGRGPALHPGARPHPFPTAIPPPSHLACVFLARSEIITLLAARANTAHGAAFIFHACYTLTGDSALSGHTRDPERTA